MKNYDLNMIIGKYIVKITFQFYDCKGYLYTKVGSNCCGANALEDCLNPIIIAQQLYDNNAKMKNMKLEITDDDQKLEIAADDKFTLKLTNDKGETGLIDGNLNELRYYIVGVEIVDLSESDEK